MMKTKDWACKKEVPKRPKSLQDAENKVVTHNESAIVGDEKPQ
jgi:hypothetical protein